MRYTTGKKGWIPLEYNASPGSPASPKSIRRISIRPAWSPSPLSSTALFRLAFHLLPLLLLFAPLPLLHIPIKSNLYKETVTSGTNGGTAFFGPGVASGGHGSLLLVYGHLCASSASLKGRKSCNLGMARSVCRCLKRCNVVWRGRCWPARTGVWTLIYLLHRET